jgi:hypothetical protein
MLTAARVYHPYDDPKELASGSSLQETKNLLNQKIKIIQKRKLLGLPPDNDYSGGLAIGITEKQVSPERCALGV